MTDPISTGNYMITVKGQTDLFPTVNVHHIDVMSRPSAFNWRELRRTQLEIKRNTMNRWFSAIDGLSKFTKDDPFTAALKKDVR